MSHTEKIKKPRILIFRDPYESYNSAYNVHFDVRCDLYQRYGYEVIPVQLFTFNQAQDIKGIGKDGHLTGEAVKFGGAFGFSEKSQLTNLLDELKPDAVVIPKLNGSDWSEEALAEIVQKSGAACIVHSSALPRNGKIVQEDGYVRVSESHDLKLVHAHLKAEMAKKSGTEGAIAR